MTAFLLLLLLAGHTFALPLQTGDFSSSSSTEIDDYLLAEVRTDDLLSFFFILGKMLYICISRTCLVLRQEE